MAMSHVSFLDGVQPHRDTHIIVSMLPDEEEKEEECSGGRNSSISGGRLAFSKNVQCNFTHEKRNEGIRKPVFVDEPKYWYGPHTKMMNDHVPMVGAKLSDS